MKMKPTLSGSNRDCLTDRKIERNNEKEQDRMRKQMKGMSKIFTFLSCTSACLAVAASAWAQATFTRITIGDIVNDQRHLSGCAWGDFTNDGLLDLFMNGRGGTNFLYRNNGGGTFTSISPGDVVTNVDYQPGVTVGDYDNDGYPDLLISAGQSSLKPRSNTLYHNNGDGTFSRVSGGGVVNQLGFFRSIAWVDYDNDGFLDFIVADHGDSNDDGGHNLLFHNNGDGSFTPITTGAVANDLSVGNSIQWADYDNDGLMDLLVVNLPNNGNSFNFLYHNEGKGVFRRVLTNSVATDLWPNGAYCAAWGDYDNDGFPDLFITSDTNRLYHNNGNGTFTLITPDSMLTLPGGSVGCTWGDYDNDGYLDLFVSNSGGPNGLFHNNGDGTFTQVLDGDPVNDGGAGLTCIFCGWVDYDNDGFLDLYFEAWPDADDLQSQNHLYHNDGNTNAWLEVKLVGTVANRSAIGAKVRVKATIGGKTFWQLREINSSGGGNNVAPLVAHFGLGQATNVEVLRIEWPSGTVQELQGVAARQILTITEPPRLSASRTNGVSQFSLKGGRGFRYDIQASKDLAIWSAAGTVTITNFSGTARFVDTNATVSAHQFYRAVSHTP
jgi:hypothetical protein